MLLLGFGPSTENGLDGEELYLGKLPGKFGGDLRITRPVEMLGGQALALVAVQVLHVGLSHFRGSLALHHSIDPGDRRLGQNTHRGNDSLQPRGRRLTLCQQRFILPGDQDIAHPTLDERDRGTSGPGIEHRHIGVELFDEIHGLGLVAAGLLEGVTVGSQEVPPGTASGLRVGRNDSDSGTH